MADLSFDHLVGAGEEREWDRERPRAVLRLITSSNLVSAGWEGWLALLPKTRTPRDSAASSNPEKVPVLTCRSREPSVPAPVPAEATARSWPGTTRCSRLVRHPITRKYLLKQSVSRLETWSRRYQSPRTEGSQVRNCIAGGRLPAKPK